MNLTLTPANISTFLEVWHEQRHRARTDLLWLCNEVLGYKDINRKVHGPILDALQHFPGANEFHKTIEDFLAAMQGKVLWEPKVDLPLLSPNKGIEPQAARQMLLLYPRGHMKSTLATVAFSVQWILNYPNVRILITTATESLVTDFIRQIREHFISNVQLRQLFPELCPQSGKDGGVPELGNLDGFTIPGRDNNNRKLGPGGKDITIKAATVGKAITGYHGDVEICDDLVEKLNSSSQNGIDDVIRHFGSMGDLLDKYITSEGPRGGWVYVTGTPWDYSDLYQVIRNGESEREEKKLPHQWTMVIRSAAPNWPDGPYLYPELMGHAALKKIEDDPTKGPAQLSAQYLMNPIVLGQGLIDDIKGLWWMPRVEMDSKLAGVTLRGRLDLAGMDANAKGADNDYSCLTVAGFSDGILLVPYMRYARPPAEVVVDWIFQAFLDYPAMVELIVEKASGASPLESWLRREMSAREKWLPVRFVSRSNQETKKNRIKALRPWFERRRIALSTALAYKTAIESEIKGFPKYRHDDFLDTLSDHMVDAKGIVSGDVLANPFPDLPTGSTRDNISILLAQAESDRHNDSEFDRYTGWPS